MYSLRKEKVSVIDRLFLIGGPCRDSELQPFELDLLKQNGTPLSSYNCYSHLYLLNKITTCSASKAKKRIDYCIMYEQDDGVHYGLLKKLIMLSLECFAILIPLLESTEKLCSSWIATNDFHNHYIPCYPPRSVISEGTARLQFDFYDFYSELKIRSL